MKYKISIPTPCGEKWNEMTPTEQGRFCSVCQAEVIDFTTKPDADLLAFIQSGAQSCGRYKKTQLEQVYVVPEPISFWRSYFKYGLVAGLGLLGFSGGAQSLSGDTIVQAPINDDSIDEAVKSNKLIKGIVVDTLKRPLYGVSVIEKGTLNGVTTDSEGRFELQIGGSDTSSLEVSFVGFESQNIPLQGVNGSLEIVLKEDVDIDVGSVIMGAMVWHDPSQAKVSEKPLPKRTLWQRFKHVFKKKKD